MDAELGMLEPHTPYEQTRPHVIVGGNGTWVRDESGRDFIDAVAGLWCVSLGYSEPRLIAAAERQFKQLPFYGSFGHRTNDVALELAQKLASIAPVACRVMFANSGSEAVDTAIKLSWYYQSSMGFSDRSVILSHDRAYHGSTGLAASACGLGHMHGGFSPLPLPMFEKTACPDLNSPMAESLSESQFEDWLLTDVEEKIRRIGPDRVAAMVAEPVLGAGGLVIPPAGYLRRLKALLSSFGILLVLDEVITAFGRTGAMFGAEFFGVVPDIMTVAKGLSSGYLPISATLVADHVCAAIDEASSKRGTLGHGFTYAGHPVSAAVALETLRIMDERQIARNVREVSGPALAKAVDALTVAPGVSRVRSLGLLAGVDIESQSEGGAAAEYVASLALEVGLIVRPIRDTLVFAPPLVCEPAELREMVARLGEALDTADLPGGIQ